MKLFEVLPEIVLDMESSLVRLGRGRVADQLRELEIESWRYDEFVESTYVAFIEGAGPLVAGEVLSLADDIGVSIDLDTAGRVMGIDILGYEEFLSRLGKTGS
jgi:uncharacterized protein YuzE